MSDPLPSSEYVFSYDRIGGIYGDKYNLPDVLWKMNAEQFDIFIEAFIDGERK